MGHIRDISVGVSMYEALDPLRRSKVTSSPGHSTRFFVRGSLQCVLIRNEWRVATLPF